MCIYLSLFARARVCVCEKEETESICSRMKGCYGICHMDTSV